MDFGDFVRVVHEKPVKGLLFYKVTKGGQKSNTFVDVPVATHEPRETIHEEVADVVHCILAGGDEHRVLRFRVKDVVPAGAVTRSIADVERIKALEAELCRFYQADGSFTVLSDINQALMLRISAAAENAKLREKGEAMLSELTLIAQYLGAPVGATIGPFWFADLSVKVAGLVGMVRTIFEVATGARQVADDDTAGMQWLAEYIVEKSRILNGKGPVVVDCGCGMGEDCMRATRSLPAGTIFLEDEGGTPV